MTMNRAQSLALFPLCDVHSILLDAIKTGDTSTSTRPDALVFAWLLELPKGIDAGDAARAVLAVARSSARGEFRPYQRVLIRELEKLVSMVEEEKHPVDPRTLAHGRWKQEVSKKAQSSIRSSKRRKQRSLEKFLLLRGSRDDHPSRLSAKEQAEKDRKIQSDRIKKARDRGLFKSPPDKPK
ncbi:MAG: hypothetical protein KTR35_04060 [Gammaproteobacteria bacterium]|nr:hypothetical protein [Gammaproteobacteria bacterium]